jgi:hypothetical protein
MIKNSTQIFAEILMKKSCKFLGLYSANHSFLQAFFSVQ